MNEYKPITIIIRSANRYRAYTTQQFTIRSFVVALQRYNPDYEIVDCYPGECKKSNGVSNEEWLRIPEYHPYNSMKSLTHWEGIEEYIKNVSTYRAALNGYYLWCAKEGIYPTKRPDKGVERRPIPEELMEKIEPKLIRGGNLYFLKDSDNPFDRKEDVLLYYDGRRYTATRDAESIDGYILIKNNEQNEKE